jgi:hypothetical protein
MAYKNTNISLDKKQEEKIVRIKIKRETKDDFLFEYGKFCKAFLSHPDNPWKKDNNPIYNLKKLGINKIGKSQKKVIYFLYDFFKKGKPVFYNYENISNLLEINQTNISKLFQSLVDKEIIFKENFKNKNGGGEHQVLILPNLPNLKDNFQKFLDTKLLEQNKESYLNVQVETFCKHSKNKDFFSSFSCRTFKAYISTLNTNISNFSLKTKHGSANRYKKSSYVCLKPKEKKTMRLQLKCKTNSLTSNESLLQEKKIKNIKNNFARRKKSLNKQETFVELSKFFESIKTKPKNKQYFDTRIINKLNYFVINDFGFEYDIKSILNINNLDTVVGLIDNKIVFKIFDLLKNDGKLTDINTKKIIDYYNSKNKEGNKKITVTNINKDAKVFKKLNIIISHLMLKHSINDIKRAIDRFDKNTGITCFKYSKKVSLLDFLINYKDDPYLKVLLTEEDDRDIFPSLVEKKTKYEKTQKEWEKIFVSFYSDEEEGRKIFKRYKFNLINFVEDLIEKIVNDNLETCGYHLTSDKNETPILIEYIGYLMDNNLVKENFINIRELTNKMNWKNFIQDKMRSEYGLNNFFYKKRK